jgi:apoptosis-inducing factor 2
MATHDILILGGNIGGLNTAHYLLRHTIPALKALNPEINYHVTVVSPSTHFLFKIASPRVIASPAKISTSQIFVEIEDKFKQYPSTDFTFQQGTATSVNPSARIVTISLPDRRTVDLPYNTLVIATGAKTASLLWSLPFDHTETEAVYKALHTSLPHARSILVAGGGAAGVETAGEIAEAYPKAKTTLLSGTTRVLPRLSTGTSARAEQKLGALGVNVIHNVRVSRSTTLDDGRSELHLSNDSQQIVDVYIDATGGIPNTDFLPAEWLDANKRVAVNAKTLRGEKDGMKGVYAIGDAGSYSSGGVVDILYGVRPLASSIGIDIAESIFESSSSAGKGKEKRYVLFFIFILFNLHIILLFTLFKGVRILTKYWYSDLKSRPVLRKPLIQTYYNTLPDTQVVPIGSKTGVMQVYGWRLPGFFAWLIKGRDYMIASAVKSVRGDPMASV